MHTSQRRFQLTNEEESRFVNSILTNTPLHEEVLFFIVPAVQQLERENDPES